MRYVLFCLLVGLVTACAGPQLERLHGEPKAVAAFTTSPDVREKPVIAGMKEFLTAAKAGRMDVVWMRLSALTRRALDQRARTIGKRGPDLLRAPDAKASAGNRKLYIGDPLAAFAMAGAVKLVAGKAPMRADKAADGRTLEQTVTLRDKAGKERVVRMRFEGLFWRVHAPAVALQGGS